MGGLRLRLLFKLRNSERFAGAYDQEDDCQSKSKCKSPVAPYFRRDEEEEVENGRAEKFCLSPVNPKRLDISYPSPVKINSNVAEKDKDEAKAAGETAFKRHLAKATVVSMGCGCRALARTGRRRKNGVKKEQKKKEKEKEKGEEEKIVEKEEGEDATAANKYRWEEEEKWHVIAKVKDEIVQKKVVLRRRNEEKCPPGSPVPSPETVSVHSCFARRKNKNVQRKKKTKTKKKIVAKDAAAAPGCNYRLSTSSADTAVEATAYSWDNDHGSFVSDGNDTLFSASDYCKSLSSESSFEFYESRSPHLSTITESPARNNSRRSVRRSVTRRSRFSSCSLSPANVSPRDETCEEFADKLPLLSSPDSGKLFEVDDDYHSPKQSLLSSRLSSDVDDTDLEANAKTWRDTGFPLRRDDIRTVIYKSSELRYSPNCLPFPIVTCGREMNGRRKSSAKSKNPTNSSAKPSYSALPSKKGDGGLGSERKCQTRRKSSKATSLTDKRESNNGSRPRVQAPAPPAPESNNGGKVGESVAVVKSSQDPYQDFRTSMLEMIVEKQIFQPNDLEQLLQCFLSLNSHHHHEIIVQTTASDKILIALQSE
ncbi:hypothetical protein SUGI_0586810 [Cryptomeria japonica]|nr:hypothetical protein SUGI_0586810 [Cryptomeria japonica]